MYIKNNRAKCQLKIKVSIIITWYTQCKLDYTYFPKQCNNPCIKCKCKISYITIPNSSRGGVPFIMD